MASKSYPRAKRVGQQIQRALSELIRRELRDPRLGMITLTEVRMSPDLGYATVYYSVLGADPHLAQGILTQAAEFLRGPLGRALGIRHSPELRFVQDELIESGARLSALINQAVKKDVETHVEDPPASEDVASERDDADVSDDADGESEHDEDDPEGEPPDDGDAHYNSDDDADAPDDDQTSSRSRR
jgi:ribosome-binding factor A